MKDVQKAVQANIEKAKNKYIGQRFGRLLIIDYKSSNAGNAARVICKCDCGIIKIIKVDNLRRDNTRFVDV